MSFLSCAACEAKSETISILREQIAASQERESVLQKANLALVDARAAAIVHRKPRPAEGPREVPSRGQGPETWDGMRNFVVPETPLTREAIEDAFRQPAGVNPAGFGPPQRSA